MSESRRWSTSKSALPCWLTFTKRFVFSSRSADVSISRFLSATLYFGRKRKFSPFEACLRVTSTDSTTLEEAELTRATTSLSPEV